VSFKIWSIHVPISVTILVGQKSPIFPGALNSRALTAFFKTGSPKFTLSAAIKCGILHGLIEGAGVPFNEGQPN
jgi:hypothetical protein